MWNLPARNRTFWISAAVAGALLGIVAIAAILILAPKWPFSRENLAKRLEAATGARVEIRHVRLYFFPHPGCDADQLTFALPRNSRTYATVRQLRIRGLYSGLLGSRKHLRMLDAEGVAIAIPPAEERPHPQPSGGSRLLIDRVLARDATLEFADAPAPLRFGIHRLVLDNYTPGEAMQFDSTLRLPKPPGELEISGRLGRWISGDYGNTEVAGSYKLHEADLGVFQGIAGKVSSAGRFEGPLRDVHVRGATESPDFTVRQTQHSVHLQTQFTADVDGTAGNVQFQDVSAQIGDTRMQAHGALRPSQRGKGKILDLHIASDAAHIEDLLFLFVKSDPPLQGNTRFDADVQLPSEGGKFVERVAMHAVFGIGPSRFTNPRTQQKVDELSVRARGDPKDGSPPLVVSDLKGDAFLQQGTALFRKVSLSVPGATALLHGRYNLETQVVDLRGDMRTEVKLSRATTGMKAFLMKVIEFAKKKDKRGAMVPVRISGTYHKPQFEIDAPGEK